jgi:hypothetical protein
MATWVRPTRARILAAERSSRPLGLALVIGDLMWEGANKLGEHIVLTWIADRLQEEVGLVNAIKWTVDHPIWFLLILAFVAYPAFVCLRVVFGTKTNEEEREDQPPLSARTQGRNSHAIGLSEQGENSRLHIGNVINQDTTDIRQIR